MMRIFGALLVAWLAVQVFIMATSAVYSAGQIVAAGVVGALIMWAFFSTIQNGSKTARVVLTIYLGSHFLTALLPLAVPRFAAYVIAAEIGKVFLSAVLIALVNTPPISTMRPPEPAKRLRPQAEDHEHKWAAHELLNDWLRCTVCREMHSEAGVIAVINQRGEPIGS